MPCSEQRTLSAPDTIWPPETKSSLVSFRFRCKRIHPCGGAPCCETQAHTLGFFVDTAAPMPKSNRTQMACAHPRTPVIRCSIGKSPSPLLVLRDTKHQKRERKVFRVWLFKFGKIKSRGCLRGSSLWRGSEKEKRKRSQQTPVQHFLL